MQGYTDQIRYKLVRGKKRAHWGILTLDDLPKTNWRYIRLIAQLEARYKAAKELGDNKPGQKSEDISP